MAYEQKPGEGALFKNEKKSSDTHPNLTGSLKCPSCGADHYLDGWTNDGAKGKWIKVRAKLKQAQSNGDDPPWAAR